LIPAIFVDKMPIRYHWMLWQMCQFRNCSDRLPKPTYMLINGTTTLHSVTVQDVTTVD